MGQVERKKSSDIWKMILSAWIADSQLSGSLLCYRFHAGFHSLCHSPKSLSVSVETRKTEYRIGNYERQTEPEHTRLVINLVGDT